MKKKDLILLGSILLAALLLWLFFSVFGKKPGDTVKISIDGNEYGKWSLFEDREIILDDVRGRNVIVIEDGKCYMREADCPDKICINHKPINRTNETIICLPHRLVVEIIAKSGKSSDDEIDATTR